jgi:hypothetical protein
LKEKLDKRQPYRSQQNNAFLPIKEQHRAVVTLYKKIERKSSESEKT